MKVRALESWISCIFLIFDCVFTFFCFLSIFAEDVEVEDNEGEPLDEEDRRRHDDDEDEEDGASFIIVSRD